ARLGVSGRYRQRAAAFAGVFLARVAQVFRFEQQAFDDVENMLAGLGHAHQALAVALENLHAQLVFQLADLAADAGLRSKQHIGDLGQVIATARRLPDGTQLLKIHGKTFLAASRGLRSAITPPAGEKLEKSSYLCSERLLLKIIFTHF